MELKIRYIIDNSNWLFFEKKFRIIYKSKLTLVFDILNIF